MVKLASDFYFPAVAKIMDYFIYHFSFIFKFFQLNHEKIVPAEILLLLKTIVSSVLSLFYHYSTKKNMLFPSIARTCTKNKFLF